MQHVVQRDDSDQATSCVDHRHPPDALDGHQANRFRVARTFVDVYQRSDEQIAQLEQRGIQPCGDATSTTMSRSVTIPTGTRLSPI